MSEVTSVINPKPETRVDDRYLCESCAVFGSGSQCWVCGSEDLKWGRSPSVI